MTPEQQKILNDAGIRPTDSEYPLIASLYAVGDVCADLVAKVKVVADRLDRRERYASVMPGARWSLRAVLAQWWMILAALVVGLVVGAYVGRWGPVTQLNAWRVACSTIDHRKTIAGQVYCTVNLGPAKPE